MVWHPDLDRARALAEGKCSPFARKLLEMTPEERAEWAKQVRKRAEENCQRSHQVLAITPAQLRKLQSMDAEPVCMIRFYGKELERGVNQVGPAVWRYGGENQGEVQRFSWSGASWQRGWCADGGRWAYQAD